MPKPDPVISPDQMKNILTDMYLTDGLMTVPEIRKAFEKKDSVEVYMDVIAEYGYTKEEFDENLRYYFTSKQKKFEQIYAGVMDNLSVKEDENKMANLNRTSEVSNLWGLKPSYRLPDDGIANPIKFVVPIRNTGTYTLRYRINVFEDDQSVDLSTDIYFWYDDGTEEGARLYWDKYIYEKTGRTRPITLVRQLDDSRYTQIRGELLSHSPKSGHWEMHSSVSGISLTYEPFEEMAEPGF